MVPPLQRETKGGLMPHPAMSFPCPYCGAEPHQQCRHTMLDGQPVTDMHQLRIRFAEEESWTT
jgi:hypothetical protein